MENLAIYGKKIERFVIRTFRILGGLAIAIFSLWPLSYAYEQASVRFSEQSLTGIAGVIVAVWFSLFILLPAAFAAAFGEGPKDPPASN